MLSSLAYVASSGYLTWIGGANKLELCVLPGLSWLASHQYRHLGGLSSLMVVCCYNIIKTNVSGAARIVFVNPNNVEHPIRKKLAVTIEKIVSRTQSLIEPRYVPTFWAANTWSNLLLLMIKQRLDRKYQGQFRRETLTMEDGGTVAIDWPLEADSLSPDAPIVIFLHTVTGSGADIIHYTREATRRGWRSCVFTRRGHGNLTLTSAKFNMMGDAEDTAVMVDKVVRDYPDYSYLAMVGISAGSGLLITYLGKQSVRSPVQAAVGLCPAWDVSQAFKNLAHFYPIVDAHLLESIKKLFLKKNFDILNKKYPEAMKRCNEADNVQAVFDAHYNFAGFDSLEEYYRDSNPMNWVDDIFCPTLIINSEDDMVCLPENIREDVILSLGGALLLRTQKGSHIAFNEGILGQGNYQSRIAFDFLESSRELEPKVN